MSTSTRLNEQDLPRLAGQAVERALATRGAPTELDTDEAQMVGGAGVRFVREPLTMQPVLTIKPGDWAGPLLAQAIGQVATNPAVNAGQMGQQFQF